MPCAINSFECVSRVIKMNILKISCLFTITAQALGVDVTSYCEFGCLTPNVTHGVCINKEKHLIENCPNNTKIIDLNDYKDIVLKMHNNKREFVASGKETQLPPASRMGELYWDENLAELAEYSARRCLIKDPYCYKTLEGLEPGRSANNFKFPKEDVEYSKIVPARIVEWLETSDAATKEMILHYPENPPSHADFFGRAIIDMNNQVGCAASEWVNKKNMKYFLLVCLYRIDTIPGDRLYKVGSPGSRCNSGPSKNYKSLCSVNENYDAKDNHVMLRKIPPRPTENGTKTNFEAPEGDLWHLVMK